MTNTVYVITEEFKYMRELFLLGKDASENLKDGYGNGNYSAKIVNEQSFFP